MKNIVDNSLIYYKKGVEEQFTIAFTNAQVNEVVHSQQHLYSKGCYQ
ncbi:MAG: hypothetical protein J0L80_06950 [Chitinophagales bacterium]|nr:hypothetical protein [Chitinophagales bacterium]